METDQVTPINAPHPYRGIVFQPNSTILRIVHENPEYRVFAFPVLAGFAYFPLEPLFNSLSHVLFAGLLLLLPWHFLAELVLLFATAYALSLSSVIFGGNSSVRSLRALVAWSHAPLVPLGLVYFAVNQIVNMSDLMDTLHGSAASFWLMALNISMVVWSYVLLVCGLSALQKIGIMRALLSVVSAFIVLFATLGPVILFFLVVGS